jgi:general secretion pathway protein G
MVLAAVALYGREAPRDPEPSCGTAGHGVAGRGRPGGEGGEARLARTLGTLLRNGVSLVNAISIARETMGNAWMALGLAEAGRELKTGRGFAKPLWRRAGFPPSRCTRSWWAKVGRSTACCSTSPTSTTGGGARRGFGPREPVMIVGTAGVVGAVILHPRRDASITTCPSGRANDNDQVPMNHSASAARARFTLLELVMVLVIIGVILAMVGPRVFNSLGRASSERAKVGIEQIGGALELYKLDTGRYPSSQEGLGSLVAAPSGVANWNGPYVKDAKILKDPWSRDFTYRSPAEKGGYDLISLGADGKEGGEGENTDIRN